MVSHNITYLYITILDVQNMHAENDIRAELREIKEIVMGMANKQKEIETTLELLKKEMLCKTFDIAKSSHAVTFFHFF